MLLFLWKRGFNKADEQEKWIRSLQAATPKARAVGDYRRHTDGWHEVERQLRKAILEVREKQGRLP